MQDQQPEGERREITISKALTKLSKTPKKKQQQLLKNKRIRKILCNLCNRKFVYEESLWQHTTDKHAEILVLK